MNALAFTRGLEPRNRGFQWSGPTPPYEIVTPEQAKTFDWAGAFLLPDAFTPAEMDAVADAIEPFERAAEERLRQAGGQIFIARADAITFTNHLVAKSAALRAFSLHRVFRGLCRDLIGPRARMYWDQAVYKKPGNPDEFPWHQDNGYTFVEPQQYLTCWVALNDATPDNGCPWVVPGLHRQGTLTHWPTALGHCCLEQAPDAVAIPAAKGSVVVFSSLTPHRTGPNLTRGVRKSYILQYMADGARAWPAGGGEPMELTSPDLNYPIDEAAGRA